MAISKPVRSSSLRLTCVDSGTSDRVSGIGGDTLLGGVSYRVDKQLVGGVQLLWRALSVVVAAAVVVVVVVDAAAVVATDEDCRFFEL